MKSFKQYIFETVDKNTHLEHLEDEVFNGGVEGTRRAIYFLTGLRDMLRGNSTSSVNVTVKWDGAPAIVCGTNPENGKFFVATKSAFNKNPKLNYTHNDIENNHSGSEGLVKKLKLALDNLKHLGIKGVLQGDLLFTQEDLVSQVIDGEKLITFTANTITYAVPEDSELAQKIKTANIGIVFHTTYTGKSIPELKASFGASVSSLKKTPSVWATDATFRDESGTATLTATETGYVSERLSLLGKTFRQMDSKVVTSIITNEELRMLIKTYINSKVKVGQNIEGTKKYATGLIQFIVERYQKEIDKLKTDKGKQNKKSKLDEIVSFVKKNQKQFIVLFMVSAIISDIKGTLISKLKKVNSIGTFLQTADGYKVTSPEGFVAIDHSGKAVKLVDRLEFSRANFTLEKSW